MGEIRSQYKDVVIEDEGVMPRDILAQVWGDWYQLIRCSVQ